MSLLLEQCQMIDHGQTKGLEDIIMHFSEKKEKWESSYFYLPCGQIEKDLTHSRFSPLRFRSSDSETPVAADWTRLMMPHSTR